MSKRTIIIVLTTVLIAGSVLYYFIHKQSEDVEPLLNREVYDALYSDTEAWLADVRDNETIVSSLKQWAADNGIVCNVDDNNNIIFTKNASEGFEDRPMTVLCMEYDYHTAASQASTFSTLQYIVKYADKTGPLAVIFFDNSYNLSRGVRRINEIYFPDGCTVIYLSSGDKMHTSLSCFSKATSIVRVSGERVPRTCDTGIRIKISGLETAPIGPKLTSYTNPVDQFRTILTRMNNKSMTYELADVQVRPLGNMYPTELEATILVNSYSIDDMKKYLEKRQSAVLENNPDATFTYEIIEDADALPETVYTSESRDTLTNFLYTAVHGTYRKHPESEVPETLRQDDVYAYNLLKGITMDEGAFSVYLYSAAIDEESLQLVLQDISTAAQFTGAYVHEVNRIDTFRGDAELAAELSGLYGTSNNTTTEIPVINDNTFVACSYLYEMNPNVRLVHLTESPRTHARITNMLLYYLALPQEDSKSA